MKKPIIGIVSNEEYIDKGLYKKEVYDVNADYVKMIYDKNGIPIIIPSLTSIDEMGNILKQIDGLLLIGGTDISKECYESKKIINKRDKFEIELYKFFRTNHKPVLGICRGLQLINVAEGGTLMNISKKYSNHSIEADGFVNHHFIIINTKSKLYGLLNEKEYPICSIHHQKIGRLGKNLVTCAKSRDNVIEAIESNDDDFVIGLQGHVEKCLVNFNKYNRIIDKFIEEAANGKK